MRKKFVPFLVVFVLYVLLGSVGGLTSAVANPGPDLQIHFG